MYGYHVHHSTELRGVSQYGEHYRDHIGGDLRERERLEGKQVLQKHTVQRDQWHIICNMRCLMAFRRSSTLVELDLFITLLWIFLGGVWRFVASL